MDGSWEELVFHSLFLFVMSFVSVAGGVVVIQF